MIKDSEFARLLINKFAEERTPLFVIADLSSLFFKFSGFITEVSSGGFVIDSRLPTESLPSQLVVRLSRANGFEYGDMRQFDGDSDIDIYRDFERSVGGIEGALVLRFPDGALALIETKAAL